MDKIGFILTFLSALGTGLIAGAFFIFSVAVMRALERVPGGMAAMQSINIVIINPMFLGVFMGTAVLCIGLAVMSVIRWQSPGSVWLLAGCLLYLIGSIGVTMIFNVPMNDALVATDPASTEGQKVWADYLTNWTFWNHVRTVASLAASASFIAAMVWK
ncbi:MAG TPA: anthrone oxygenase family protein [Pyrinomonadaceae bacterium]|nr:anthrone oxygenase family protein [Pyrinomonadaceae bacterium]